MNQKASNERGYTLKWLMEYQNRDMEVAEFMEGAKILEVRLNEEERFVERAALISIYEKDFVEKADRNITGVKLKHSSPSFLVEKDNKHYIVAIDPVILGWQLHEVIYD